MVVFRMRSSAPLPRARCLNTAPGKHGYAQPVGKTHARDTCREIVHVFERYLVLICRRKAYAQRQTGVEMKRRTFMTLVAGAATWPVAAQAQQAAMPVIGFLGSPSAAEWAHLVTAFQEGLKQTGYVEGQNAAVEYRWADGDYHQLPRLADDLVQRNVAVIFAAGSAAPALAAKAASTIIPIVFAHGADPVKLGLVASLNRPGGNITRISFLTADLGAKRLGLMHELAPHISVGAVLINPNNPNAQSVA